MSFFSSIAGQVLSAATSGGGSSEPQRDDEVRKTGGQEYNAPHYGQRPQGSYNTDEVLSHAQDDGDGNDNQGYIKNAIQHVHENPDQHQEQVGESDLSKYGPLIFKAISSASSGSGSGIGSLLSGGSGAGGGNQLMGLVLKEAGKSFTGGSAEEKQSFMSGAAMTLTKVVAQKQLSSFVGGSNSGGLGMLASKLF